MSSFVNTEQTFSLSGLSNIWLAPNASFLTSRNSGGQVNIAAPVLIKAIYATVRSGFTGADTSGQILVVCDCVSGGTSGGNITGNVLFFHYAGGLAASGGTLAAQPYPITGLDYIARSGLSTFVANSGGTYVYNLNVVYAAPQV